MPLRSERTSARRSSEGQEAKSLDGRAIEEKALAYLNRFDASASRLRQVLEEFVRRRATALAIDATPYLALVDETLARYRSSGLVDDRRFAASMARTLAERGASRQAIRAKLFGRGVEAQIVEAVISELGHEVGTELDAARALVRKRRLGQYRPAQERGQNYRRDLAVLARAGFDFDTAKAALSVEGAAEEDDPF